MFDPQHLPCPHCGFVVHTSEGRSGVVYSYSEHIIWVFCPYGESYYGCKTNLFGYIFSFCSSHACTNQEGMKCNLGVLIISYFLNKAMLATFFICFVQLVYHIYIIIMIIIIINNLICILIVIGTSIMFYIRTTSCSSYCIFEIGHTATTIVMHNCSHCCLLIAVQHCTSHLFDTVEVLLVIVASVKNAKFCILQVKPHIPQTHRCKQCGMSTL